MKKRILSVALIATMLCTLLTIPAFAKEFPDAGEHWAKDAINVWSDRGVVNGDDAGNFRPGDPITRAETAKLMDNLIEFQKTSNKVFSDVATDAWYADSVNKLYAAEVLTGYEDGTIRPGNSITRQEAAVIIARAFAIDTKKIDQSPLSRFGDLDLIQDWARPVVAFMAEKGFIQGDDAGNFRPADPITRAEIVTILNNMVGIYADGSSSTYKGDYGNKFAIVKAPAIFSGVTLGGAVVCGAVKGKVNFNSGSKINGCLCNWSKNASVSTAGAKVTSTSNKNGGSITAGGNFNSGYSNIGSGSGNGSIAGGSTGGSAGGSSGGSNTQYSVTYYANGGTWDNQTNQVVVNYNIGNSYAIRLPMNPSRTGFVFAGWYTDQAAANTLAANRKLDTTELVNSTSCKHLYAGWKKPTGLYGKVAVAVGDDVADRGMSASELMDGVTLTETSAIDFYQAKGGLRYVTGYTNSPTLNTDGNFLALTYTLPENIATPSQVTLTSGFQDGSFQATYNTFTAENRTYTRVFEITAADLAKDIVFTVDVDGSGLNIGTITVDLASLIRYQFVTVTTLDEFTAALANPAAEKITVTAQLTLTSGTYGSANAKKEVVLSHGFLLAKDANVVLQQMNITAEGTIPALIDNTTEIPEPAAPAADDETTGGESSDDATTGSDSADDENTEEETPTPVATKAASLTLSNLAVTSGGMTTVLDQIQTKSLILKQCYFSHNTQDSCNAITVGTLAEGDSVVLEQNTFDHYTVAVEYKDITALNTGVNVLKKSSFLNNTTDIKLPVADTIPNIAYNYFDEAPVLAGPDGAITDYYGPLYTDVTLSDTALSENTYDAYLFIDGTLSGKLSEITALSLTFADEETPCEITLAPTDARNTVVTINNEAKTSLSLLKSELPAELTVQVGLGTVKTLSVNEAVTE